MIMKKNIYYIVFSLGYISCQTDLIGNIPTEQQKKSVSWIEKVKAGIIPDGLEKTGALIFSAIPFVSTVALETALKNDFSENQKMGWTGFSALVSAYTLYKTYHLFEQRTPEAIKREAGKLRETIAQMQSTIKTPQELISHLRSKFTHLDHDFDVQVGFHLKVIIEYARWLNSKLIVLGEPVIDIDLLVNAFALLQKEYKSPDGNRGLDFKIKAYQQFVHDNKASTKLTKVGLTTTKGLGKAVFYTTKYGIKSAVWCADKLFNLTLVTLHAMLNKIL